jgi:hypothetical protein
MHKAIFIIELGKGNAITLIGLRNWKRLSKSYFYEIFERRCGKAFRGGKKDGDWHLRCLSLKKKKKK